jgi:hypothetical protein
MNEIEYYKQKAKEIYIETNNNLTATVKAIKELRPQTHASSIKSWIDPEYAKRKNEQNKKASDKWKEAKPEKYKQMVKKRTKTILEKYHSDEKFRQDWLNRTKDWRDNNPEQIQKYLQDTKEVRNKRNRKYENTKRKNDFSYRLLQNMRAFVRNKLKRHFNKQNKPYTKNNDTTCSLIGCTAEQLANHLRSLYKQGMTDQNHGKWHIDHIVPCSSFDLTIPEQRQKCFHYKNLQPLWAAENLAKSDKIV